MPTISQPTPVLPPHVRARTILSGCVRVDLADLEAPGATPGMLDEATALLEWGGAPFLAAPAGLRLPARVRLTCRADVEGLGVLRLTGSCEDPQPLETLPLLHRLVRSEFDPDGLVVAQVVLETVRVLTPATAGARAASVAVALDRYYAAEPDVWALHGARAAAHLEEHHQGELLALAGDCLPAADVCQVFVRSISRVALDLSCLLPDGVTSVRVAFADPVENPAALAEWLTARLRRIAEDRRD